ncbi:MAG: ABC transporter ATP-binding protein [Actinobacteria bacterium]|nr:ABC transporter ATP-binding protein [Actinomycetota bacterium]MBO0784511.1 ABC transporter ATP-binding protein [Actinomycetota bacterium]MBO0817930.1 ABC transporter ATP-binding protein [Actinomycetota bacterium]
MLQAMNVTKTFGAGGTGVRAVDGVSLTARNGEFVAIVGRSGSGKSTLMNLLGGLEKPTRGSIEVDGRDITRLHDRDLVRYRRRQVGFVFQSYNLVPNLTALGNVMLPMEFAGTGRAERKRRARQLLNQVELPVAGHSRKPGKLSGGEQQRVAIARALANDPGMILADEPTGNLDTHTSETIVKLLHSLAHTADTTVLVVTHDPALASQSDKTFHLADGRLSEEAR